MVHGDDKGFVLPPRVAENKIVKSQILREILPKYYKINI